MTRGISHAMPIISSMNRAQGPPLEKRRKLVKNSGQKSFSVSIASFSLSTSEEFYSLDNELAQHDFLCIVVTIQFALSRGRKSAFFNKYQMRR